jgi:hypothetical protein
MSKIPTDTDVLSFAWKTFGRHPAQVLPREAVREVRCPACHAETGFPCFGRTSNHSERCFERIRLLMLTRPDLSASAAQAEDEVALSPDEWGELSSSPPTEYLRKH